jgi:hypothetical protein
VYRLEEGLRRDPGTGRPTKALAEYYEGKEAAVHRRWLTQPDGKAAAP